MAPETRLFGILAVGIDDFKRINAAYGHGAGNAVLTKLAQRLGWSQEKAIFSSGAKATHS